MLEAVHFHQQLVERLFAFIVPAAQACATLAAHGIDFIDENDRRRRALGLIEQIAHAARAHAHKHLHKIRTGNREEGHARFARNRAGQQRFARARRAHQKYALGNARAHLGEPIRRLQEFHNFLQLVALFIRARHILECDAVFGRIGQTGPALGKIHYALAAAGLLAHQEEPECQHHADQHQIGQKFQPPRRARRQLRAGIERIFRGRNGIAVQHGLIDLIHIRVELFFAGNRRVQIVARSGELRLRNVAIFRAGNQHVLHDDHIGNRFGSIVAQPFIGLQVRFDPFQQFGIGKLLGLFHSRRSDHRHKPKDEDEQQHIDKRPLQILHRLFIQTRVPPSFALLPQFARSRIRIRSVSYYTIER